MESVGVVDDAYKTGIGEFFGKDTSAFEGADRVIVEPAGEFYIFPGIGKIFSVNENIFPFHSDGVFPADKFF